MLSSRYILSGICRQRRSLLKLATKMTWKCSSIHDSRVLLAKSTIEVKMPSLSPTMTEGTIVKWLKKEGDTIEPGDVLCEIQTDKAVVGLEVEEEGILSKIIIPEDTKNVRLGEVIALIEGDEDVEVEKTKLESKPGQKAFSFEPRKCSDTKTKKADSWKLCGPSVKKLFSEYGIDFATVNGSGPRENILKGDVLKYIERNNLKKKPILRGESIGSSKADVKVIKTHVDIPVSNEKRNVADQLIQSKVAIPHAYMNVDCKIKKLFDLINTMESDGIDVSLGDFLVKSAAVALRKVPKLNIVSIDGKITPLSSINVSINVEKNGSYVTLVVENADNLAVELISKEITSLTKNTSESKMEDEKFTGGSFRISNLGLFGVTEFSAVIYPPEVAILAVGSVQLAFEGKSVVQRIKATLSFNNEIISEDEAGEFMGCFKEHLENPLSVCLN